MTAAAALVDAEPTLEVFVPGAPVGQGRISHNAAGRGYHSNDKQLRPWRRTVVLLTRQAIAQRRRPAPRFPLDGPVMARLDFVLPRGRTVRRPLPAVRPDLDHLIRAALDSLTAAHALVDDGRVVTLLASKTYPDRPAAGGEPRPGLHVPGLRIQLYEIQES